MYCEPIGSFGDFQGMPPRWVGPTYRLIVYQRATSASQQRGSLKFRSARKYTKRQYNAQKWDADQVFGFTRVCILNDNVEFSGTSAAGEV